MKLDNTMLAALVGAIILSVMPGRILGRDIYVSSAGDGTDGDSWSTAYQSVQAAAAHASDNDVLLLRGETFELDSEIKVMGQSFSIVGGYEGVGAPGNQDRDQWSTILKPGANNDQRAFYFEACPEIKFESLTIVGFKGGGEQHTSYGGAIHMTNSTDAVFSNLIISNNQARYGGAISSSNPSKTYNILFDNCLFISNRVAFAGYYSYGGSLYLRNLRNVRIVDSRFLGNNAQANSGPYGGALYSAAVSTLAVDNSLFQGNWLSGAGTFRGGALYINAGGLQIQNCVFRDNHASGTSRPNLGGGICADSNYSSWIRNTLFEGNTATGTGDSRGGAIEYSSGNNIWIDNCTFVNNSTNAVSRPDVHGSVFMTNCVFQANGGYDILNQVGVRAGDISTGYCNIEDGYQNERVGNMSKPPLFMAPSKGDYRLRIASPCRDAGLNLPWMDASATDLIGHRRIFPANGRVDIGAYESGAFIGTSLLVK